MKYYVAMIDHAVNSNLDLRAFAGLYYNSSLMLCALGIIQNMLINDMIQYNAMPTIGPKSNASLTGFIQLFLSLNHMDIIRASSSAPGRFLKHKEIITTSTPASTCHFINQQ